MKNISQNYKVIRTLISSSFPQIREKEFCALDERRKAKITISSKSLTYELKADEKSEFKISFPLDVIRDSRIVERNSFLCICLSTAPCDCTVYLPLALSAPSHRMDTKQLSLFEEEEIPSAGVQEDDRETIKIYTDGGCNIPYNYLGAWAFVIVRDGKILKEGNGWARHTTNNRMELTAMLEAVKAAKELKLDEKYDLDFITDSQYVQRGITQWYQNWLLPDGTLQSGVKNADLWKYLDFHIHRLNGKPSFSWVKGHAGNRWNEHCDEAVTRLMEARIRMGQF